MKDLYFENKILLKEITENTSKFCADELEDLILLRRHYYPK